MKETQDSGSKTTDYGSSNGSYTDSDGKTSTYTHTNGPPGPASPNPSQESGRGYSGPMANGDGGAPGKGS